MLTYPMKKSLLKLWKLFCSDWQKYVRVEYKQEIKHIPKIVSSFANTQGSVFIIVIEVDQTDNKVIFPIKGIPKPTILRNTLCKVPL